jgi:hypothetical protein
MLSTHHGQSIYQELFHRGKGSQNDGSGVEHRPAEKLAFFQSLQEGARVSSPCRDR